MVTRHGPTGAAFGAAVRTPHTADPTELHHVSAFVQMCARFKVRQGEYSWTRI